MSLILIIAIIWGASALARASKEVKAERERERLRREQAARSAELQRMTAEWKQRQAEAKIETARLIAVEREQMRLAKEQEKQADILRKHEERLLRLEQKLELAQRDEAHYANEVTAITIDMNGVKAYVDYMRGRGLPCKGKEAELEKLSKKLYAAETKLIKARQARELCEKQMEVT